MKVALHAALTLALLVAGTARGAEAIAPGIWSIEGGILPGHQPDGNSYVLEAPDGLIVIDTGRHAVHREKIEALARDAKRPVVAIVNTHWHLDHVSGNVGLREQWPQVRVYASDAIDHALTGFLATGAAASRRGLDAGRFDAATADEVRIDLATIDAGAALRPDVVIDHDARLSIAGRPLEVHLAKDAATAGDVWVYDPATRIAFVGDLVTFPAAFLDTACSEGWKTALDAIAQLPFERIAPGHGPLLTREGFANYRAAFTALAACAASTTDAARCGDQWIAAVSTIGRLTDREQRMGRAMTRDYVTDVLRPNAGRSRYCEAAG